LVIACDFEAKWHLRRPCDGRLAVRMRRAARPFRKYNGRVEARARGP
jgi:hypothetical protein